jgi:3-deoxy-D-manno-octulosonic-acid transferase
MVSEYNLAVVILSGFFLPYLLLRFLSEKKHRIGLSQRLGFIPREVLRRRSGRPVIWIHSVSVGEVLAAAPLVAEIRKQFPGYQLLLSTTTVTGQGVCRKKVAAPDDLVIYCPLDLALVVRRVLSLFSPRLILLMETEIWPNLIVQARRKGIHLLLVNGRLSDKSFHRYLKVRSFVRPLLRSFSFIGMQTEQGRERVLALGASPGTVSVTGSMKYEAALSSVPSRAEIDNLRKDLAIPQGRVLVAGSTHRGEEQLMGRAYLELRQKHPDLFLIVAPRHPERFQEVQDVLRQRGIPFFLRSAGTAAPSGCHVMVLDTLGELTKFYALADVAFIGKSLTQRGGHNPLEPASCGKPVIFGPHMDNFREVAALLVSEGGAIEVSGFRDLVSALDHLLGREHAAREMGRRARRSVESRTGGVARTAAKLRQILEEA